MRKCAEGINTSEVCSRLQSGSALYGLVKLPRLNKNWKGLFRALGLFIVVPDIRVIYPLDFYVRACDAVRHGSYVL